MSDQSQASYSSDGSAAHDTSHESGVDGGGGDVVDFQKAFQSQQRELAGTKSALQDYMGRFEQVRQKADANAEVVDRMRQVFDPEAGKKEADPTTEWQAQLDHYLKAAWEADKAGKPMPLTTNLAVQFFQDKIAAHEREKALTSQIGRLEQAIQMLMDPNREVNHRAASGIDATIEEYVERLYGNDEATFPQRAAQYEAIAKQVKQEIRNLQQHNPGAWEAVRRDPKKQERLVKHVVEQNQPPKVRQILEQERIKNTPMSDGELYAAFQEARQIKDEKTREKILPQIRADIISRMWEKKKGQSSGVGRLYNGR